VSVRVRTDASVADLTTLAHQLDDDVLVEAQGDEARLDRVAASHGGDPHRVRAPAAPAARRLALSGYESCPHRRLR
jgi:hypothetical protein